MYLRPLGTIRDRTADLMSFRGAPLKPMQSNREMSEACPTCSDVQESPLDRFFQLSSELRQEISDLHISHDALLKKHKACLRPTFTDPADFVPDIEALTAAINARMQQVTARLGYLRLTSPDFPDRERLVANLRAAASERFREFSAKFKLEQQAFSVRVAKAAHNQKAETADFGPFDFGTPGSDQRQFQMQLQRNEEEVEAIMRRAEAFRNIFLDLANLISEQGTLIDRIDFCISHTLENAVEAHTDVEKAAHYQGKSRMWICVVVLLVLIALLLLMAYLK
jgi:hypothetical protein